MMYREVFLKAELADLNERVVRRLRATGGHETPETRRWAREIERIENEMALSDTAVVEANSVSGATQQPHCTTSGVAR